MSKIRLKIDASKKTISLTGPEKITIAELYSELASRWSQPDFMVHSWPMRGQRDDENLVVFLENGWTLDGSSRKRISAVDWSANGLCAEVPIEEAGFTEANEDFWQNIEEKV